MAKRCDRCNMIQMIRKRAIKHEPVDSNGLKRDEKTTDENKSQNVQCALEIGAT